ncbi:TetR/AcrR family transcriptional regulator [Aureimonas fodinaquatilis]|uniref:TetR/AcrR family transcriptional regulator n=1 Tax=Aureimonas fodinaquatilis TaxID=2565783 RepID=A0A5B0DSC7_9HYPH|nr:TetR/AcrR family transcriptional regulator [Aureimonas fodinaquatilis]KAA0969406.1 TetR/AcrR family transcriptional regulator [Aureimonas fodinaquatilis]
MVKRAANSGERTADAIRRAGLKLIYQKGYAAVSMRDLAQEVGIGLSSIYNHISTKQALLVELLLEHMNSLLAELRPALAESDGLSARDRLLAFLLFHLRYHLTRRVEVFVINSELRSLEPDNLAEVVALRRAYEDELVAILQAGKADGSLIVEDPQVTAFALISMLTGVCNWYNPDGRLSQNAIIKMHVDLIFSGLSAPLPERQLKAG